MKIGISLACFYPQRLEETVQYAKTLGVNTIEIFINTFSELDECYVHSLAQLCDNNGLCVYSLHPFTSAIENYLFFSPYDRRIKDSKKLYSMYCNAAKILGAKVINIHGDRGLGLSDINAYVDCLAPFIELSSKYGITFSHENVFYNSINKPEFVRNLRDKLGKNSIKFTFDIKQANKGGTDPYELCEAMGADIINFHVNDFDANNICLLPGNGIVNHKRIFDTMTKNNYDGPALIEVYSSNYKNLSEIKQSVGYLNSIL